jgi:DNA-binding XRE family transcriptional regulator
VELKQVFGTSVRHHRLATKMKQWRLAELVELSEEMIGKIERGVAATSFTTAEKIAEALGVSPLAFFGICAHSTLKGERRRLLIRIDATLADMNEEQMARAANILDAFMGRRDRQG